MTNRETKIKLIALDMDGTLLTDDNDVSEYTKEVIAKALHKGIHIVLSTGRPLQWTYPFVEMLNLHSPIITVNGGEIWTASKKLLERHQHESNLIEKLWQIGHDAGINTWMASTEGSFRFGDRPDDFSLYEWLKIGFNSDDLAKLDGVLYELSRYRDLLEITNSLPTNIEINPSGVNKARALDRVCEEIGITMNNVMAIGDSINDQKMIEQARIGVAVNNAQKTIKDISDFVTESNNEHGVAKAIERYAL